MTNVICAIKVEKRITVKISGFVPKRAAQKIHAIVFGDGVEEI